jgi:beta-galactosidase/beta-glucuronidase
MSTPEQDREEDLADRQRVTEEAEAAAAEAGHIGGDAPTESDDPSQQPLIESGQGESEGFELAEQRLRDIASHGDEHRFPDRDVRPAEDREQVERGEADETIPRDG